MNALKLINENENIITELKTIRERIKSLEISESDIKLRINKILDAANIEEICIGADKVKRSLIERNTFDSKSFESLHPDLYNQFIKKTAVISLRVL